jgi:hypothetical protein
MALSFADALEHTSSKKLLFAQYRLRKELFGWIEVGSAHPDIWYEEVDDVTDVVACTEDEEDMTEVASLTALDAQDTSTVGAFFWDAANGRTYVKPKSDSGADIFTFLYIATVLLTFSKDGGDLDSLPYDGRIADIPRGTLRVGEIFDGKVTPLSTGNVKVENSDLLFCRRDLEIDGEVTMVTAIEIGAEV